MSAATTTTALLAFQLLWPFLICGTLLGLFTCCRKKAKTDANGKSQVGPSSSTRTALDDSKKGSQKGKPKKKDNLSSKKDAGVATSADGFPIFPILKTDNSTVVCTLSASTNTPNDDNNAKTAYTMQSMTKSLVKSAPKTAKAPVPQKEAAPPAEPASKEEKPAKAPTDAKTMVTKEESSKATSKVETPKSATSKTEPSKPETSKDSPATPVSSYYVSNVDGSKKVSEAEEEEDDNLIPEVESEEDVKEQPKKHPEYRILERPPSGEEIILPNWPAKEEKTEKTQAEGGNSALVCTLSKSPNTAKSSGVSTAELESSTSKPALTQDNLSLNSEKMESIANNDSEKATKQMESQK